MIDRKALLADLRRQLKRLEQDLAERSENVQAMKSALEAEYRAAREVERTGDTFQAWRAGALTQAAVAWLLGCVFVRFVEDNGLVDAALIAGPGERNARAADRQTLYFRGRPTDTDRDYLLNVFAEVARLPGMARLYDREHNPVWRHGISGDAARDLLAFWRAVDPDTGALHHDFTDPDWDTRFLGDLYQDLSDEARKRFALLQTPEFVEEFILDRTLTPALDEFGLAELRLIDPACGSGHFLLGAFARLAHAWFVREPGTPERVLAQRALDGVHGVDLNPFAVAIARFRLLVTALRASRIERIRDAPDFRINVAAGDSLLHGRRFDELDLGCPIQPRTTSEWGEQHLDVPYGGGTPQDELNQSSVFRLTMPIPGLNQNGLLPRGVHDCTLDEIAGSFAGNPHRKRLFQNLVACLEQEIRPVFDHPIFVDGSFVTDKDEPGDVDIVLDLKEAPEDQKFRGLMFMKEKQSRFSRTYNVHFLVNFDAPGFPDFSAFFQYVRIKTARIKSLDPRHMKGILRIFQ